MMGDNQPHFLGNGFRRQREGFSWRATLFSERGTLFAIAGGYLLLWLKLRA